MRDAGRALFDAVYGEWAQLRPGARIVSHAFTMGDWQPEKRIEVDGRYLYLWRIPSTPPKLADEPK